MTALTTVQAKDAAGSKARGTGFPVVPLPEAAKLLGEIGKYGAELTRNAFAEQLGHDTSNSGPFRAKLAAFKDWGLITTNGDRVVLTQLGREIALDDESAPTALREAFESCRVFMRVYEDSAKGVDLDAKTLSKKAVLTLGVAASSGPTFARSLILSAAAAGYADALDGGKRVRFTTLADRSETPPADDADVTSPDAQPQAQRPPELHAAPLVLRQLWSGDAAHVLLEVRSSRPLPASAFAKMGTAVEAAQSLAELVGAVSPADPSPEGS